MYQLEMMNISLEEMKNHESQTTGLFGSVIINF